MEDAPAGPVHPGDSSHWPGQYPRLAELAQRAGFAVGAESRRGLPYFLLRFRRRYALLAGVAVCPGALWGGGPDGAHHRRDGKREPDKEEIISQLRLCGVSVGTYGPNIPIREVENQMMLAMDQLTFFSLNLHGTRAEVIVREKDPAPELREETVPTDVISSAAGVITHIEPWVGDAMFQEGEAVLKGDVLISGHVQLDIVGNEWEETDPSGEMLVHAEGEVWAETWHTMTRPDQPAGPDQGIHRGGNHPIQPVDHGETGEILSKQWNFL